MKFGSLAFTCFWLLAANPLVLNPAIASIPARPTQPSRCKTLGPPAAPVLEFSIETPPFPSFPSGDEAHVEQLGQLAEQFAKAQQFSTALTIATQLDASYCQFKTKTLLAMAQSTLAAKQPEAANQILSQAMKTAQTLDDRQVQFETLLAIATDFSSLGQQTQAAQILTQTQHLVTMH